MSDVRGRCPKCWEGALHAQDLKSLPYAAVLCSRCGYHYLGVLTSAVEHSKDDARAVG